MYIILHQNYVTIFHNINTLIVMSIQTYDHNEPQHEPEYQQDYDQQQQPQDFLVIQQKQPQEKVISLAKDHTQQQNQRKLSIQVKQDPEQKERVLAKLKEILNAKIEETKQTKKRVEGCKKEIKDIGEQVDKEMNKSILKHSKPHATVDIRSIFQTPKSSDPQINKLTNQLNRIRNQTKKVKAQIKALSNQILIPLNMMNSQRAVEVKAKMKQAETELKKLKEQKQFLDSELKMIEQEEVSEEIIADEEINNNQIKNAKILTQIKQQKNISYELQRQDRVLTEKIRFIKDLQLQSELKRSKASISSIIPKEELQSSIKRLVEQIQQIIDKRNKVQSERKATLKSLESGVSSLQAKNWEIINKLREIDAQLIRHYSNKLRKPKTRKDSPKESEQQLAREKLIKSQITTPKTVYVLNNDKNVSSPKQEKKYAPILVQKRKIYEFFMTSNNQNELNKIICFESVVLSDEIFGTKLNLKKIIFILDENMLYGLSAQYENEYKNEVKGFKIMSKIKPKDTVSEVLLIDNSKNEVINFVHIGIDEKQYIKYLHLITSEAKQFKWGDLENCVKNEQKNIRKYESITIKGKLNQISDKEAPNYYCLGGIGFSTVYLSPK